MTDPRGWACLLEASLLEASFVFEASLLGACLLEASLFLFEATRLEACFLEASLSVSFRWVFGGPGHLRGGVNNDFPRQTRNQGGSSSGRHRVCDPSLEGGRCFNFRCRGGMGRTFLPRWGGCRSPVLPFWEVAAIQTSALFWGVLAPPNPGVVPPPSGAKFALQDYMNRETNRDTGEPMSAVTIPNAILILEGSPLLLVGFSVDSQTG